MDVQQESELIQMLNGDECANPIKIAEYFITCYKEQNIFGFLNVRDAIFLRELNQHLESIDNNAPNYANVWKRLHRNLYHVACIADNIIEMGLCGSGSGHLMWPFGYGAAEVAGYYTNIFNYTKALDFLISETD